MKEGFIKLLLYALLLQAASSYSLNVNTITDLTSTDSTNFNIEVEAWSLSSYYSGSNKVYTCDGTILLGGYEILGCCQGNYFERVYTNLPGHTAIYFSINMWIIDSIDDTDGIDFYFDGTTISMPTLEHNDWDNLPDLCGTPGEFFGLIDTYPDLGSVLVTGTVAHSGSSLDFRVITQCNSDTGDESFGFRDITFTFVELENPATTAMCTRAAIDLSDYCTCPEGYYSSGSSCLQCNAACATCFGAGTEECFACNSPYIWDGTACIQCDTNCNGCYGAGNTNCLACASGKYAYKTTTCLDTCTYPLEAIGSECTFYCTPDQFLYWDNTCSPICNFPLQMSSVPTTSLIDNVEVLTCNYPCASGEYLYWDGFCRSTCDYPLSPTVTQTKDFCDFPCTDSAEPILYWNQTCSDACYFPLSYVDAYGKQFCEYPCTTGQCLYDNGSCIAAPCRQYFITYTYNIENLCYYPCLPTETLYSNGSCLPQPCQKWFISFAIDNDYECQYPCLPTQYLYNNGSCLATCDWRFTANTTDSVEKSCDYSCTTSEYLFLNGTCIDNCPPYYNAWFDKMTGNMYCDHPCQPAEYLYSNGSCLSTCQTYYIPVNYTSDQFCNYPCQPTEYLYSNGTCLTYCHPNFLPIIIGQDKFCNYPCNSSQYLSYTGECVSACDPLLYDPQTYGMDNFCYSRCKVGDYLYENGTCSSSCPSDFNVVTNGQYRFCNYPCESSENLYNNGTCVSSCDTRFISNTYSGNNFCSFPCSASDYLHDNGTCLSSCNALFVHTIVSDGREKYCQYPCSNLSDYIYWNGSCLSSCVSPYQSYTEGTYQFCLYPCLSYEYLYWNDTCHCECKFPLVSKIQSGLKYCDYPCSTTQYLLWNGSCVDSCEIPYRIKNQAVGALCALPCDDPGDYYYEDTGECEPECDMNVIVQDDLFRTCVSYDPTEGEFVKFLSTPSDDPGSITFTALTKLIQYLRYLNISYPLRVQRVSQSQGMNPISYVYVVPLAQQTVLHPTDHQILPIFDKYGLSSSFIVNFWSEIIMIGILLVAIIILFVLEFINSTIAMPFWQNLFTRIRHILGWNLVILILTTNIGNIILYATLELGTLKFDSGIAIASFVLCFTAIVFVAGILFISSLLGSKTFVLKEDSQKTKSLSSYAKLLTDWQGFQIVYRGFDNNKLANSLFYLIYVIRSGLPMVIAVNLYEFPMVQTTIYVLINIGIIGFMVYLKPIKKYINHIQLITIEFLVLIVNIAIFLLVLLETADIGDNDLRIHIGDVIVICNAIINVLVPGFLIIKLCTSIRAALSLRKTDFNKSQAVLLQTLFLPLQQAGFGFEQVQIVSFYSNPCTSLPEAGESKSKRFRESFKRLFRFSKNNKTSQSPTNAEKSQETKRQLLNDTTVQTLNTQPQTYQTLSIFKNLRNYRGFSNDQEWNSSTTTEISFPICKVAQKTTL